MSVLAALVDALRGRLGDARIDTVRDCLVSPQDFDGCLDELGALLGDDPATASAVAGDVAAAAEEVGDLERGARGRYLQAQGLVATGDLAEALRLIGVAARGYQSAGRPGAALRTNLGRSHVLNEMGRHDEALDAADSIVRVLASQPPADLDAEQQAELVAYAQQNRGLCCELTSRYPEALEAYAAAEAAYRQLGDPASIGEVVNDRGLVLMALGRIGEAIGAFRSAAATFAEVGHTANHANALTSLAEAQLFSAQYRPCLDTLNECRSLLADIDVPVRNNSRMLVAARAYEALNLHPEAIGAYREVIEFSAAAGMVVDEALARWGLGRVERAVGHRRIADRELALAADTFSSSDHRHWSCGVWLDRAQMQREAGAPQEALELAGRAVAIADAAQAPVEAVRARVGVAQCLDLLGRRHEAAGSLRDAREIADGLGVIPLNLMLDHAEGLRALHDRDWTTARQLFTHVAARAEWDRAALGHDAFSASFMADKVDVFDALVTVELAEYAADPGPISTPVSASTAPGELMLESRPSQQTATRRVVAAIERARSRALFELISRRSTGGRSTSRVPSHTSIAARQELDALYSEMLTPGAVGIERAAALRERSSAIEQRLNRTRLDDAVATAVGPPGGRADEPPLPVLKDPVLSWFCLGDEVLALLIVDDQVTIRRSVASVNVVTELVERLDAQWDRLHLDRDLVARHAERLTRSCRQVLGDLYRQLISPVVDLLPAPSSFGQPLTVVAHGVLHRVPVHALFDGQAYVVEGYEVTYAPSIDDLATRSALTAPRRRGALVMGVPDERTPGIGREVRAVAGRLGDVTLHCGAGATAAVLLAEAPHVAIVHVACHALFRADNPMFSSLQMADRWVAAHELLELDLSGSLVVMSACDSGRTHAVGGDELLGLTRAVLGAGARTLVAALWPAHDEATVDVMDGFYAALEDRGPGASLRRAQLAELNRRPHPYHWAPFVVIGGR